MPVISGDATWAVKLASIIVELMRNCWSGKEVDNPYNLEVLPLKKSVFYLASYWQLSKTTQNQTKILLFQKQADYSDMFEAVSILQACVSWYEMTAYSKLKIYPV